MPKRRTAKQAAASRRNLERARHAQIRGNNKLGTANRAAAKSFSKGETFKALTGTRSTGRHSFSAPIPTPTGKAGRTTAARTGIVSGPRHGKG